MVVKKDFADKCFIETSERNSTSKRYYGVRKIKKKIKKRINKGGNYHIKLKSNRIRPKDVDELKKMGLGVKYMVNCLGYGRYIISWAKEGIDVVNEVRSGNIPGAIIEVKELVEKISEDTEELIKNN